MNRFLGRGPGGLIEWACLGRLIAWVGLVGGCSAPSLLITPVSSRRDLTESVLYRDGLMAADKIAVIEVAGLIVNSPRTQLLGEGEHPVSLLLEQLNRARRDPRVKAVILRINSPGGTVVASELMHAEIRDFRRTGKRVVAVLMDVAASGGYYIACACDEIVAQPSTITGSIGVLMQTFDVSGTLNYIGVKSDAIISGIHKDSGSPLRPMRPEERVQFQDIVQQMFERFVQVVREGRPALDEETVRRLADGRVYLATKALELGLIDRIETMRESISRTKKDLGIAKVRVVRYHRPTEFKPTYYSSTPSPSILAGWPDPIQWALQNAAPQFLYLWSPGR